MPNATVVPRSIFRLDRAERVMAGVNATNVRLTGVLAAEVSLLEDTLTLERIDVREYAMIGVAVSIAAGGQGACAIDLYPMSSDATHVDTTGTRIPDAGPTTVTAADVSNASVEYITMDVTAFEYVDVELDTTATGSDQTDLTFVDVFLA